MQSGIGVVVGVVVGDQDHEPSTFQAIKCVGTTPENCRNDILFLQSVSISRQFLKLIQR